MDNKQARYLHRMLDRLAEGKTLNPQEIQSLRKSLPEPPAQKTLEEITEHVREAWVRSSGNIWTVDISDPDVTIEGWLRELYAQLKGVKSQAHPALPAGMRLADHAAYGRVVTSPKPDQDGVYVLLIPKPKVETGADWEYAHECELTFVDNEPAHPEFLETEADYRKAPEGTIVACEDSSPWHKFDSAWLSTAAYEGNSSKSMSGIIREVLRWGDGE